ncbi:hypothetical protein tb265_17710 [Gemmatimonadetes bacterium T265]|nr:hypothetical protein tb265_17710 [Gemmatimonadetes bacterium T265]
MLNVDPLPPLETFVRQRDGVPIVVPCLELVAFSKAPVEKAGAGFARFFAAFRARFGDQLALYNTADMKGMKRVGADTLDMVPFWFEGGRGTPKGNLAFYAHSGASPEAVWPPAFEMFCDRISDVPNAFFRMVLPADRSGGDADPFLALVHDALDEFPLLSGYAGYSFLWRTLNVGVNAEAIAHYAPLLRRHPGFVHGKTMEFIETALFGVVTVDWLTLLGPELAKKAGGAEKLAGALAPDATVQPLGKGLMLRAGPRPQFGDVNRHDRLPAYQRVARALKKLRAPADQAYIEGLTEEQREEWFARFD